MTETAMGKRVYGDMLSDYEQKVVQQWYRQLSGSIDKADNKAGGDVYIPRLESGLGARLRRTESLSDVAVLSGFNALYQALNLKNDKQLEAWLVVAAVLAYVKEDVPMVEKEKNDLPFAAGRVPDRAERPLVSELRFQQLLKATETPDFMRRLRRVVVQIGGKISVVALANDILRWFAERQNGVPQKAGNRLSVAWAMRYYQTDYGKKSKF